MLLKKKLRSYEGDGSSSRCLVKTFACHLSEAKLSYNEMLFGIVVKVTVFFPSGSHSHLRRKMRRELLSVLSGMADLSNAIHWMPPGFLWAGRFPNWLVGLMGTISSLIGLIQMNTDSNEQTDRTE